MKNADYWKKRSEAVEKQLHKQSEEYYKEVEKQFRIAEKSIAEDIEKWYARLAVNNDISLAEAREFLDKSGLAEIQWTVEEYIRHGKENGVSKNWEKELENASAQWHIRKLEAIQLQMQHHLEVLYAGMATGMVEHLSNIYKDAYYRKVYSIQQGLEVGATVTKLDSRRVEKALQHCWAMDGKIFSDRIWQNKQMLTNELNTILTQSIIRGENPGNYITALSKKMKTSRTNASRLIYTESAAIAAQADKDCYKDLGIEEFEFLATLDSRTSELCLEMDGRHFPMSEYKIGVNVPPLHPFCRSTTCPYFDDEFTIGEERAARGEDGKVYNVPANMTYEEWYEEYVASDVNKIKKQYAFEDVKNKWMSKKSSKKYKIEDLNTYTVNGTEFVVDGHNVIFKPSDDERRIANILAKSFGGTVQLVPRVLNPQGIKTPDYIFRGEKYDLKTVTGSSKNVLYNALKGKRDQAENFIFDISQNPLNVDDLTNQARLLFESKNREFVKRVILIKDDNILNVFERK